MDLDDVEDGELGRVDLLFGERAQLERLEGGEVGEELDEPIETRLLDDVHASGGGVVRVKQREPHGLAVETHEAVHVGAAVGR